jgi:hypothetical protein
LTAVLSACGAKTGLGWDEPVDAWADEPAFDGDAGDADAHDADARDADGRDDAGDDAAAPDGSIWVAGFQDAFRVSW